MAFKAKTPPGPADASRSWTTEDIAFRLCWITTLAKMGLAGLVLLMPNVVAAAFNSVIWFLLLPYLALQIWGSAMRKVGTTGEWAIDNTLAIADLLLHVIVMVQGWFWVVYGPDHHALFVKGAVIGAFDLAIGLVFSQRLAESTKARDES